ncbi:hypothetical protein LI82_08210 [Methanococcoides methylutens]|uniref:Uncharacterized protein n=1 Tax=Methanococcoides methylutens TaxID=2226 RepID=A0A099T0K3_METMT|nr:MULTISPECIES: hypothetical protein [Methanococcoides]KGK97751.1 hypothetical protein LI82_08210 [Methanococcoides methylutens]UGV41760.1 hypothetical protein J7W08_05650 [Methanococcoides orientis]
MQCTVCGVETENKYCNDCEKILEEIIQKVGEKRWSAIDDCSYIYPMIKRAAKGELTVNDIINAMEVED